jgi:lipoprotein-anchoring transpeptidase ErfK/SrfK
MASKPVQRRPKQATNSFSVYTQPIRPVRGQPAAAPQHAPPPPRVVRPVAPAPYPQPIPAQRPATRRPAPRRKKSNGLRGNPWLLGGLAAVVTMLVAACAIVTLGAVMLYGSGGVLNGVQSAGVALGGLTVAEAADALSANWGSSVTLRDGQRVFPVDPALIGLSLDVDATAERAYEYGRSSGGIPAAIRALSGTAAVEPVVIVDEAALLAGLQALAPQIDLPATNAGVQLVNGAVQERPSSNGRAVDVGLTVAQFQRDPAAALADGSIDLQMATVAPSITDAGPMVAAASALLANPFSIRAFDPIEGDTTDWILTPQEWSQWLTAEADASSDIGLRLRLDEAALQSYLHSQEAQLGGEEYIRVEDAAAAVNNAIGAGETGAVVRVYHHDRQHTVQPGETVISIAWDYGVPYPYIQQANPGADNLSPGQTLTIPSPDNFMDYEPVYGKRIVVSISGQWVRVYENGSLLWDWVASTGISSSPTWPGIYQIISHEPNAYAGNWDLWMPNFMGVYRPIPGADFTNGFHGFPTRGGSQLLWTNNLGTRVTYGCILLGTEQINQLYAWAEEGVVVEIQA